MTQQGTKYKPHRNYFFPSENPTVLCPVEDPVTLFNSVSCHVPWKKNFTKPDLVLR